MWRLDTDKASFAIKQLSSHINLSDTRIIKNYELSESIAARFIEQGIPAICAISKAGKYLFIIEGTGLGGWFIILNVIALSKLIKLLPLFCS